MDIGLFSFGVNMLMLVMPLYMLQIYDRVLTSSSLDTLVFLSVIAVFALAVLGILEAVRSMYGTRVANRFELSYARPAMMRLLSGNGDIRVVQALGQVRNFLNTRLAFVLFDLPFAPLFIMILYFIHPVLFWMTTSGAVLLVAIAILNQWMTSRVTEQSSDRAPGQRIDAQSLLQNAESLRALGMTSNALREWEGNQIETLEGNDRRARVGSFMTGLSRTIRLSLQIAVLGVGAYFVLNREMTAGMIFAASIISSKGLQPIDQVIGSWRQIVDGLVAFRTVRNAVDLDKAQTRYTILEAPEGEISAENIVYRPAGLINAKPTLKGISFALPAGKSLGILGKSGAGKSTLLRLLVGAVQPDSGTIRVDKSDIQHWDPEVLGRHFGYVEQRVELLPGTIAQNIARFDEDATDENIIAAARAARVQVTIETMPEGYQTVVGTGQRRLSGGELQLVGLARAFYGDPQILLLDEPNASLDPEARRQFDIAIRDAKKAGKTIVMVTQRQEVLEHVDLVLAIRDGRRVDYGPRDEVLKRLFGKQLNARAGQQSGTTARRSADGSSNGRSPFANYGPGMRPIASRETEDESK